MSASRRTLPAWLILAAVVVAVVALTADAFTQQAASGSMSSCSGTWAESTAEIYCTESAQFLNHELFWPTEAETCEPGTGVVSLEILEFTWIMDSLLEFAAAQAFLANLQPVVGGAYQLSGAPVVGPTVSAVISWPVPSTDPAALGVDLSPAEFSAVALVFEEFAAVQAFMRNKLNGRRRRAPAVRRDVRRDRWRRWAQEIGSLLSITEARPCSQGIGKPFRVLVLRESATRRAGS